MTANTGEYVKDPLFMRLKRSAQEEPWVFWPLAIGLVAGLLMTGYSGYHILFGDFGL